MNQHPSTEVVAAAETAAPAKAKVKKIVQVGGAATFAIAMFGTLALPAYAFNEPDAPVAAVVKEQTIKVTAGPPLTVIDDIPLEVDTGVVDQERREKQVADAKKRAAALEDQKAEEKTAAAVEVPAGEGASGIVAAALAQLGVGQDCTDLVQNALAAVGLTERRDQGGYDHGVGDFTRYGQSVTYVHGSTELAPGDILLWGGAHVAVYVGGGSVVHGGWTGNTTALAGLNTFHGLPTDVVRMS